jgi:hypothetical protein
MNRADRKLWASARTLDDLCELTAMWLEGELEQTPGHLAQPCEETAEIAAVLAGVNRAHFLTWGSQPGRPLDEHECCQYAAVTGFIAGEHMSRLRRSLDRSGLFFAEDLAPARRARYEGAVTVTVDGGRPFTWFGAAISRRDLRWEFSACHRAAVAAVCDAWQVTVVDTEPGRNSVLWPLLADFAGLVVAS